MTSVLMIEASKEDNIVPDQVLCIHYPIQFKKKKL